MDQVFDSRQYLKATAKSNLFNFSISNIVNRYRKFTQKMERFIMALKIIFHYDITWNEWIEYAFNILCSSLDCTVAIRDSTNFSDDTEVIFVSYGMDIPLSTYKNHLHIFADSSFWSYLGKPKSLPRSPMYRFSLCDLRLKSNEKIEDPLICPYVYDNEYSKPVYWQTMGSRQCRVLVCTLDLLASALFWLTRYEETLIQERDEFGRIPENQLLCVRENCYARPLVDEYAEALCQLLNQFGSRVNTRHEAFRVLITHDVDSGIPVKGRLEYFENGLRSLYREVFREHRVQAGFEDCSQRFAVGLGLRSHIDSFREIIQLDRKYGYTSHFFLMANGTHPQDAPYNCSSEYTRSVIQEINSYGGKIGLHLGINSHKDTIQFETEWSNIRKVFPHTLPASRSHFLVFQVPHTWKKLSGVGCLIDTTLGFSKYIGFRTGTARPYRPFDVINQCVSTLWEYPLILMDKNLFALPCRSDTRKIEQAMQIIDKVAAHGGCLVIDWHNAYFFSDYLYMYTAILEYITKRGQDIQLGDSPEPEQKLIW
jgi:hypothetical protein